MSLTTSAHWMYSSGAAFYDYEIEQASRWQGDTVNAPYFRRNLSINRQKWTCSFWYKRCEDDRSHRIMESLDNQSASGNYMGFTFQSDGKFQIFDYSSGYRIRLTTAARFNDPAAWYHFVVRFDSTQATSTNRVRLYVNGEQISFVDQTTYPSQNLSGQFGNGTSHYWGRYPLNQNSNIHGYMADVILADGQSYGPEEFGETKSGIWIPKDPSITYGSGGFRIDFSNASSMGTDVSGNSNNWTAYNWATHDQVSDTPTNNFCTLSKLTSGSVGTLSEGALQPNNGNSADAHGIAGTFGMPAGTGKWYWEVFINNPNVGDNYPYVGAVINRLNNNGTYGSRHRTMQLNCGTGGVDTNTTGVGSITTVTTGLSRIEDNNILGVAVDMENRKMWFSENGVFPNSGNPATGANPTFAWTNDVDLIPHWLSYYTYGSGSVWNFGQDSSFVGNKTAQGNTDANGVGDFYYTPPSGFLALCSANLPDPAIDPAADDTPEDYFDTVLYTAATSNGTYTHGDLAFRPDFTWIKNRNNVEEHYLIDVVRGNTSVTNKFLNTNSTDAEGAAGVSGTTFSVTDTGYEFVESSINSGELYFNGRTYVGWNWKAGGTGVSNTDGSITSTVSANTDAGFSVVTYTGNSTNNATIGHGLGVAPKVVIVKNRVASTYWYVYHDSLPPNAATYNLYLNANDSQQADNVLRSTNSTTFTVSSSSSANGSSMVAYCFAEKEGYSKFGSYIGNGSSDGTFIYTGFRPALIIMKRTDSSANWIMVDNRRIGYNFENYDLSPDQVIAEEDNNRLDIVSNGFKFRSSYGTGNTSGGTYIYLAFAEQPFKYANAR